MYNCCTIVVELGFLKQIFITQRSLKAAACTQKFKVLFQQTNAVFSSPVQLCRTCCVPVLQHSCAEAFGVFSCHVSDHSSVTGGHWFSIGDSQCSETALRTRRAPVFLGCSLDFCSVLSRAVGLPEVLCLGASW